MTRDLVCGMQVDEKSSQFSSQFEGKQYAFCSEECKKEFDQEPEQFVRSAA